MYCETTVILFLYLCLVEIRSHYYPGIENSAPNFHRAKRSADFFYKRFSPEFVQHRQRKPNHRWSPDTDGNVIETPKFILSGVPEKDLEGKRSADFYYKRQIDY